MSLVADNNLRSKMSPVKRALLDRILTLRPAQQRKILQLIKLHQEAASPRESEEIGEVLAEILFRDSQDMAATPIGDEPSANAGETLRKHRMYVATQIKKRRRQLKMSQQDLAARAGIPQSHVCRLETGKHAPTYLTIEKLANALDVAPSQLDPGFSDDE
jgi:ribosome-binding protein aMBF1 (putative translation factor)